MDQREAATKNRIDVPCKFDGARCEYGGVEMFCNPIVCLRHPGYRICPVLSISSERNRGCLGDMCAWWVPDAETCTLALIGWKFSLAGEMYLSERVEALEEWQKEHDKILREIREKVQP